MITLNNNNLEITEGTFQSDSRTMLSSPSVTPEMDDNMTTEKLNGINEFYIKNHDNPYEKYYRVDVEGHYIGITKDYEKAKKMLNKGGK